MVTRTAKGKFAKLVGHRSGPELNRYLLTLKTDWEVARLLEAERLAGAGKPRLLRIHSRLNYLRAQRERKELIR